MRGLSAKCLFAFFIFLLAVALFVEMSEASRNQNRPGRRRGNRRRGNSRNNRRGRQRGRNRSRGRNRNRVTTTTTTEAPEVESTEGCEEIVLPMCKGLVSYTHTKLPNKFNHTTQREVYNELEHLWAYMDHSCSVNMREYLCSNYLPKCTTAVNQLYPCRRLCNHARTRCSVIFREHFDIEWADHFPCRSLPANNCLGQKTERRCRLEGSRCVNITTLPGCTGLTFTLGTIPNMFDQCFLRTISTELQHYEALRRTNCHPNLNFLLCGVYTPFCVRAQVPSTFPCRELCEEVRRDCEGPYERDYDQPWPNKLQCHRYPSHENNNPTSRRGMACVMPNEGHLFGTGK